MDRSGGAAGGLVGFSPSAVRFRGKFLHGGGIVTDAISFILPLLKTLARKGIHKFGRHFVEEIENPENTLRSSIKTSARKTIAPVLEKLRGGKKLPRRRRTTTSKKKKKKPAKKTRRKRDLFDFAPPLAPY